MRMVVWSDWSAENWLVALISLYWGSWTLSILGTRRRCHYNVAIADICKGCDQLISAQIQVE